MKNMKSFTICTIVFIILFNIQFLVATAAVIDIEDNEYKMEEGIMDLTCWDFDNDGSMSLQGEWELYWEKLLEPSDFTENASKEDESAVYANIPLIWENQRIDNVNITGRGYATLRTVIYTNEKDLGLNIPIMLTSNKLWVNGELVAQSGCPGKSIDTYTPKELYHVVKIHNESGRIELVLQVANFHLNKAGIPKSIVLDKYNVISKNRDILVIFEVFCAGAIFIMFIYHLMQYLLNRKEIMSLYFAFFCFGFVIRTLVSGRKVISILLPSITWIAIVRIALLTIVSVIFFTLFIQALFPKESNIRITKASIILWCIYSIFVLLVPDS